MVSTLHFGLFFFIFYFLFNFFKAFLDGLNSIFELNTLANYNLEIQIEL
jgi:hypothetical protein